MRRYVFALILGICMCCATSAFAWKVSSFSSWYDGNNTEFKVVIHDPSWEVANRSCDISFYDNKRKQIRWERHQKEPIIINGRSFYPKNESFSPFLRDGDKCDFGIGNNVKYEVELSGDDYIIHGWLPGHHDIASCRAKFW